MLLKLFLPKESKNEFSEIQNLLTVRIHFYKLIFREKAMLEQKVGALKTEMLRLREKCKITRGSQAEAMKEFMESKDHCKMSSDSLTENTDISSNCDKENRLAEMRAEVNN